MRSRPWEQGVLMHQHHAATCRAAEYALVNQNTSRTLHHTIASCPFHQLSQRDSAQPTAAVRSPHASVQTPRTRTESFLAETTHPLVRPCLVAP